MARRKIIFVVVEGPSDDTAMGLALSQVFDKESVYVHIVHGDITTKKGVTSQNIISKLGDMVKSYAKSMHYTAKDFCQILHLVDTDGAFLSPESVIDDKSCREVKYEDDGIHTAVPEAIISRNQQKRENLYRLISCNSIWGIPYRVYYMSCNMDHVLHSKRNSTDEEKERDAYLFAKRYRNNVEEFRDYILESPFSVQGNYRETWDFIQREKNSIERYTNLRFELTK